MAFLRYSLVRIALLLAVFVICSYLGLGLLISGIMAVIIAWTLSYLFFSKWRDEASASLRRRFSGRAPKGRTATEIDDAQAEDSLVDAHPDVIIDADLKRRSGDRG